jgi:hypothetical protein
MTKQDPLCNDTQWRDTHARQSRKFPNTVVLEYHGMSSAYRGSASGLSCGCCSRLWVRPLGCDNRVKALARWAVPRKALAEERMERFVKRNPSPLAPPLRTRKQHAFIPRQQVFCYFMKYPTAVNNNLPVLVYVHACIHPVDDRLLKSGGVIFETRLSRRQRTRRPANM